MSDFIFIESLSCKGVHGVYPAERVREQEFLLDLKLEVDTAAAAESDNLQDTIDYDWVRAQAEETFAASGRYLVEKLGGEVLLRLFADARIRSGEITIRKTGVWDNGTPGVIIRRSNPHAA